VSLYALIADIGEEGRRILKACDDYPQTMTQIDRIDAERLIAYADKLDAEFRKVSGIPRAHDEWLAAWVTP
jgi:hypothetical protein